MRRSILGALTALLLNSSFAQAAIDVTAIAQDFLNQGYTRVEVKIGATEVKIEAIKDLIKLEVTLDAVTGAIIKTETGSVDPDENTTPGVFIDNEDDSSSTPGTDDDNSGPGGGDDDSSGDGDDSSDDSSDDGDDGEGDDSEDDGGDDDNGGDRSGSNSGHG